MTGWGGFYDLGIHGHQTVTELSLYFQLLSITSTGPGSQSSVPGPPRKTSFHRRDPDLIQGKTTGFTYKHSPHSTSASNPSAFHLTGKQRTGPLTGSSELCFLPILRSSFITPFIPDRGTSIPVLLSCAAGRQRCWVDYWHAWLLMAGVWPSARKEVLSLRMLERLAARVNTALNHSPEHKAIDSRPRFFKHGQLLCELLCLFMSSFMPFKAGLESHLRKAVPSEKPFLIP